MDIKQATRLAKERMTTFDVSPDDEIVIVEITETEFVWVFQWNSKKYIETQSLRYARSGGFPLLVDKVDGELRPLPYNFFTHPSLEHEIQQYEIRRGYRPSTVAQNEPPPRPAGRVVQRHRWAEILFLHWMVDPSLLRPMLPPGLTLDLYEGRAYVGVIPFTMTGVRPVWAPPFPPLSDFHETNVRTYVHREGRDPGVWFFSLDAANSLAVRIARTFWNLPYHRARMELRKEGDTISYRTERLWPGPLPAGCTVKYRSIAPVAIAQPGSLEYFLTERYCLYSYNKGRLYRGPVHHPPFPLQRAEAWDLQENLLEAAGIPRSEDPPLAYYAKELRVDIFGLTSNTAE